MCVCVWGGDVCESVSVCEGGCVCLWMCVSVDVCEGVSPPSSLPNLYMPLMSNNLSLSLTTTPKPPPPPHHHNNNRVFDAPWEHPSADITKYFNYNFNPVTWAAYQARVQQYRAEFLMQHKIPVMPDVRDDLPATVVVVYPTYPQELLVALETAQLKVWMAFFFSFFSFFFSRVFLWGGEERGFVFFRYFKCELFLYVGCLCFM